MTQFTTLHERAADRLVLPVPAPPVRPGGTVYRDPLFGLKLESVIADGHAIPGVETVVFLDDLDMSPIAAPGDAHLYLVTARLADEDTGAIAHTETRAGTGTSGGAGTSEDKGTSKGTGRGAWSLLAISAIRADDYDTVVFSIPADTERITIRYRVRDHATNELGPELTLESTASDS